MLDVHEDVAGRVEVFVEDRHVGRRLHDVERVWHVGDARHPWQEALCLGVGGQAILEVFLFLGERPRLVRNVVSLDHALTRRHTQRRLMVLKVPRRRAQDLPHAGQVGLAIIRAWQGCTLSHCGLSRRRDRRQRDQYDSGKKAIKSITHRLPAKEC